MGKSYLDLLHEYETGNKSLELTDLISIPKVSASSEDIANEMMSAIESSTSGKKDYSSYEEVSHDNTTEESAVYVDEEFADDEPEEDNVISNFINKCNKKKKKKKKSDETNEMIYNMFQSQVNVNSFSRTQTGIPIINIGYSEASGKIIIEDDAAPISASVSNLIDIEDQYPFSSKDANTIVNLLADVYKVIIASKYPSVIMTKNVFELNFGILENIDTSKFMFFTLDDYVLGYVVNPESQKRFHKIIEGYRMDIDQIYSFVTNLIAILIDTENCFPYNDADELGIVIKNRASIQPFIKMVENDPATKYAGHNYTGTGIYKILNVVNYRNFMKYIQDKFFPYRDNESVPYEDDTSDDMTVVENSDDIGGYVENMLREDSEFSDEDEDSEFSDEDDAESEETISTETQSVVTTSNKPEEKRKTIAETKPQKPVTNKPKKNPDGSFVVSVIRGNK